MERRWLLPLCNCKESYIKVTKPPNTDSYIKSHNASHPVSQKKKKKKAPAKSKPQTTTNTREVTLCRLCYADKLSSLPLATGAESGSGAGLNRFGAVRWAKTRLSPHRTRLTTSPPLGGQRRPLGQARTGARRPRAGRGARPQGTRTARGPARSRSLTEPRIAPPLPGNRRAARGALHAAATASSSTSWPAAAGTGADITSASASPRSGSRRGRGVRPPFLLRAEGRG